MAIASNMLGVNDIISSAQDKINSATGSINSGMSSLSESTSKALSNNPVTSLVSKVTNKTSSSSTLGGILSDALCGNLSFSGLFPNLSWPDLSFNFKLGKLKGLKFGKLNGLDIDLSINICGEEKSLNPLDAVSKIGSNLKKATNIINSANLGTLQNLAKTSVLNTLGETGANKIVRACLLDDIIGDMVTGDNVGGATLAAKKKLKSALGTDDCGRAIANNPFVSGWINTAANSALISALLVHDRDQTFRIVEAALGIADQRGIMLHGLSSALSFVYDTNVRAKVKTVYLLWKKYTATSSSGDTYYNIYGNVINNNYVLTPKDQLDIKTDASTILDKLDKEKEENNSQTNDPSGDFDQIKDVLDIVDKTWNKSNEWDRDETYYKTAGNQTMKELACKTLSTRAQETLTLDPDTVTTKLEAVHHVAIVNSFHCDKTSNTIDLTAARSACGSCDSVSSVKNTSISRGYSSLKSTRTTMVATRCGCSRR